MTRHFANWDERTLDLAAERFTFGLDREGEAALENRVDRDDLEDFERVVAAVHLGHLTDFEPLPDELFERLERAGRDQLAAGRGSMDDGRDSAAALATRRGLAWGGWLAAAALLLVIVVPAWRGAGDAAARRDVLIASATDLLRAEWAPSEDPAAAGASGDVVWSGSRQQGYLRFRGLAPNDPEERQYQLWIFDSTRADWEAKPVDGGVFDVRVVGEVVVPIDAKLPVRDAALFAVTMEVSGGVVVSERERLVLTAAP